MNDESEQIRRKREGATKRDLSPELKAFKLESGKELDAAKVERAKQLLANQNYPSPKVIQSIAKHLANHWPTISTQSGSTPGPGHAP